MSAGREVREIHEFSREQLEKLVKYNAKLAIVGGMYVGEFRDQTVEWRDDGSAVVTTVHTPSESRPGWQEGRRPK